MIRFLRSSYNLLRVVRVVLRHGVLETSKLSIRQKISYKLLKLLLTPSALFSSPSKAAGLRFAEALAELGPLYIKLGQVLSTRPDLVGEETAKYLCKLQDQTLAISSHLVEKVLLSNYEQPIDRIFSLFDFQSTASASIAQVHKAILPNGDTVAVKIIKPGVKADYEQTLQLLRDVARILIWLYPKVSRLKPQAVIEVLRVTMKLELDLRMEAAAYSEMQDNFAGDDSLYLPHLYWHLITEQILVTSWVVGTNIYDRQVLLDKGLDTKQLATKLAIISFNQTYRDGFFHADLHPGNILITDDGQISLIDFGIMGRMSRHDRLAVAEILYSFLQRDYMRVAQVHLRANYIPQGTDLGLFAQACRGVGEPIKNLPLKDISISKLMEHLFRITEDFGIEVQPQLLLLQKTMMMIEGVGRQLDPEINMWLLAKPWITKWAIHNLSPEARIINAGRRLLDKVWTFLDNPD